MSKKTIYTVGIDLPGDDFEYIPFHSHSTLLDADLVIYAPTLDLEVDDGRNCESLAFWKRELGEALSDGKQVIVFLTPPVEAPVGAAVNSYAALPLTFRALRTGAETSPKLTPDATFLASYWQEFKAVSRCSVEFELDQAVPLLTTRNSAQLVAAVLPQGKGQLLLLPALEFDHDQFTLYDAKRQEFFWTDAALEYGKRLLRQLHELDRALSALPVVRPQPSAGTAAPAWTTDPVYRLPSEVTAQAGIDQSRATVAVLKQQLERLQGEIAEQEGRLPKLRHFQGLLYESGPALEQLVAEALALCGFVAESTPRLYRVDGVRCLCAVEGDRAAAVELERILRLEQALQDDFARDGVTDYARGLLFVNVFAATPPAERKSPLTAKALAAAKRSGFVLIPTLELFRVVQALEGQPDEGYAAQVRAAILAASGELVIFPAPPL